MKKITLLMFSVLALSTASKAQTPVNATDFTTNPDKFKGMSISISGVELNTEVKAPTGTTVAGGGVVAVGKGAAVATPTTVTSTATVNRCKAPKGYTIVDVKFPNDPKFAKCFIMKNSVYASLPINQSAITAKITFKGDSKLGYTITLFKL
jgi:hypothetical protein